jgi:DNA-binding transcriptional ArsR family regulator
MQETNDHTIDDASAMIKVLADPTRLRILGVLTTEELSVGDLQRRLGISQPLTSFHLGILYDAGLVVYRNDRQWRFYTVDREAWDAAMRAINAVFDPETPR